MNKILKDKSFQLSIIITVIFIGTGIIFLFLGLADYSWILFGLLPVVLGLAILTPRFYWEPMEKLGVQQEHDYVFNNLEKDLERKYGFAKKCLNAEKSNT